MKYDKLKIILINFKISLLFILTLGVVFSPTNEYYPFFNDNDGSINGDFG